MLLALLKFKAELESSEIDSEDSVVRSRAMSTHPLLLRMAEEKLVQ
jgi:hypothetical protein